MRTHVSLFAGIDAIGIAAEQHGYTTTACVEIDPYCRRVLARRVPGAALYEDVREVGVAELGEGIDLLSLGFPCQNLSSAGKGAGLNGDRSILWFEGLRIIRETRPRVVLIENVAVLKSRGLDVVVAGLADAGYGCWWDCVPALAVGAPHIRDRIWITAVPLETFPHAAFETLTPSNHKMPRAGCSTDGDVWALEPAATVRQCKDAMGAVKRADGVTWLTKIDQPLWATPRRSDAERGGRGDLIQQVRGNKADSSHGDQGSPLWPTAAARDWKSGAASAATHARNARPLNEMVALYPTPSASSYGSNQGGAAGRVGPVRHSLASMASSGGWPVLLPTPTVGDARNSRNATANRTPGGNHHSGTTLSDHVRLRPTPSAATAEQGPGRSPERKGGPNPRTAVADGGGGPLNPDWVEVLMGLPLGWTNIDEGRPSHELLLADGAITYLVGTENLRTLRGDLRAQAIRDEARGRGRLPSTEVLLAYLRQHARRLDAIGISPSWEVPARTTVRGVRGDEEGGGAPHRPGPLEQQPGEHPNPLLLLPRLLALDAEALGLDCRWQDAVARTWADFEVGIPRVARYVPNRKQRLMAIGNALVWQVAERRINQAHRLLGIT